METWQRAARAAGLVVDGEQRSFGLFQSLTAHVEGQPSLTVRVTPVKNGTLITAGGMAGVAALRLASEGFAQMVFGQNDQQIGDEAFDARVVIGGPVALAQATLDAPTRAAVLRLFKGVVAFTVGRRDVFISAGALLKGGHLELSLMSPLDSDQGERLEAVLCRVVDVVTRLATPRDVPRALAANAETDPLPGVRRASLLTLSREFGTQLPDLVAETLRRACDDPHDGVALTAAVETGAEARPTLLRLAFAAPDDYVAAAAIRALQTALPADRAVALLEEALRRERFEKALAALESLGSASDHAAAAAAEPLLVAALRTGRAALVEAAARVLARVGSAASVLALQDEAKRHGGATRATALWAKGAIQARLTGANPGQLSLAGGEAGEVSLASDGGGEVSIEKKDEPGTS